MLSNDSLSHENTKVNGNKNKISSPSSGGSDNSNTMSLPIGTAYNPTLSQNKSSVNNNSMQSNKNKSSQLEPQLIKFNSQRRSKVENTRLSELSNKSYHYGNKMSSKNSVNDVIDENRDLIDDTITTQDIQNLRSIGRKSINDFTSEDIQKSEKWARKFYKELGTKSPFFRAWFGDWRAYDTGKLEKIREVSIIGTKDVVKTTDEISKLRKEKKLPIGNYKNNDSNFIINIGTQVYDDTLTYANREYSRDKNFQNYLLRVSLLFKIDDIVKNSILLDTEIIDKSKNNYRIFMHTFYNVVEIDNKSYLIKLKVDELLSYNGVIRRAYNLNKIEMSPVAVSQVYKPADTTSDNSSTFATIYNISDLFSFVKQYDKEFNPKPVNPVMLNDDGTPKVFYHSTNENFTVFKKGERAGLSGKGIYFSPYQQNIYGRNSMPVYLKIENPMTKANEPDGAREINSSGLKTNIIPDFFEKFPEYDAIIQRDEVVVKDPNQIKSATDNIGTFDGNNPDIRYSVDDSIDNKYLEAVKNNDFETAQKLVDEAAKENGYIIKAYHGTSNGGFNVFDTYGSNFGLFGQGSYFTENKSVAESYTQKGKGDNKKVYECYLDIKNPLDMDKNANVEDWIRASGIDDDYYFEDCKTNEDCFKALKEYCQDDGMYKYEAESFIFDTILAMNYDGITHIGGGRYNKKDETRHRVWIAFEPNQIKSADPITYDDNGNVIPLSERFKNEKVDIRYSKDDKIDSDDKKITVGMSDSERAEILKNTVLTLADYEDAKNKVGKTVDTATVT